MRRIATTLALLLALAAAPAHASVPRLWSHGPDRMDPHARLARASDHGADWCGVERFSGDTADQVQNGDYRYHAIYVIPADGKDRLTRLAGDIQNDAMGASALLERLYGRAIRFDMGTSCGPQYLDLTTVRMPQTTRQLEAIANGDQLFSAVRDALAAAGFGLDDGDVIGLKTNYVAWLDGPSPDGVCGQGELYQDWRRTQDNLNNTGGKLALIYNPGTGECGEDVVRHEIGHNLGALQAAAPHAFDGAHCNDAMEDTMCDAGPRVGSGIRHDQFFDFGNDDYWSPPGGAPLHWWTVDESRFLCPTPDCNRSSPAPIAAPPSRPPRTAGRSRNVRRRCATRPRRREGPARSSKSQSVHTARDGFRRGGEC